MGLTPRSNFGQFKPEMLNLKTAMAQISERFPRDRGTCLLVILNGAGPNAGKTTVSGRISTEAKTEGHPSVTFEGDPTVHAHTLRALAQIYSTNGPVLVKITEYAGEFDRYSGQKMRDHVVSASEDEARDLLADAGIEAEMDPTLLVNVSSPLAEFPPDHFPADLEIFIAEATKKY